MRIMIMIIIIIMTRIIPLSPTVGTPGGHPCSYVYTDNMYIYIYIYLFICLYPPIRNEMRPCKAPRGTSTKVAPAKGPFCFTRFRSARMFLMTVSFIKQDNNQCMCYSFSQQCNILNRFGSIHIFLRAIKHIAES